MVDRHCKGDGGSPSAQHRAAELIATAGVEQAVAGLNLALPASPAHDSLAWSLQQQAAVECHLARLLPANRVQRGVRFYPSTCVAFCLRWLHACAWQDSDFCSFSHLHYVSLILDFAVAPLTKAIRFSNHAPYSPHATYLLFSCRTKAFCKIHVMHSIAYLSQTLETWHALLQHLARFPHAPPFLVGANCLLHQLKGSFGDQKPAGICAAECKTSEALLRREGDAWQATTLGLAAALGAAREKGAELEWRLGRAETRLAEQATPDSTSERCWELDCWVLMLGARLSRMVCAACSNLTGEAMGDRGNKVVRSMTIITADYNRQVYWGRGTLAATLKQFSAIEYPCPSKYLRQFRTLVLSCCVQRVST